METVITKMFFGNWQRKAMAILVAVIVWIFVNQSITSTKTIANVPVRVVNLPEDKTIKGLLPNGYLDHRLTLTLSGSRDTVDKLEQGDLEVRIDATTADTDNWVVQVTKKNLVSLEPSIDLGQHINAVSHSEFIVQLNDLVTDKIPIFIEHPTGHAPQGYDLLDIWPQYLVQTLSGPEEEIERLKSKGLKISFDLNKITAEELDALKGVNQKAHTDEVSFMIPKKWKKVAIPFLKYTQEDINDPEVDNLHIEFLRKQILPIQQEVQVQLFYPDKYSNTINPTLYTMAQNEYVTVKNGITHYTKPLYVQEVSQLFLDIVSQNIVIVFIAGPKGEQETLAWCIDLIDPAALEDSYVSFHMTELKSIKATANIQEWEEVLRQRFREYMRKMKLSDALGNELNLRGVLEDNKIVITSSD
jgi:hypothetical protein